MNPILLKNCLLINFDDYSKFTKDILIANGKIQQVADSISFECKGLNIINVKEQYVLPGFIDCHTHIGIIEEATGKLGLDNNETSNPVTPHLRAMDGINPLDIAFKDAVKTGVTCVMSGPGSNNAVGGLNTVLKTHGNIIDNMVVKNPCGLKIALGEGPISCYGSNGKCPVTRMAITSLIRELFMRAQDYMEQKEKGKVKERDIRLEAVIPLLKGDIFLRAHAHRADDIVSAIRIAEEFNIKKLVIEHGTEAHLISDYLREKDVPVAFGPILTPRIKMELRRRNYSSPLHLIEAGVKVALITDHPYNSIDQLRSIALLTVSEGLKPLDALKSITSNAAEILGCADKIGRIKEGYDADIVILNGDPLDMVNTRVVTTIINGEIVFERAKPN